jgi:hypothetical protein
MNPDAWGAAGAGFGGHWLGMNGGGPGVAGGGGGDCGRATSDVDQVPSQRSPAPCAAARPEKAGTIDASASAAAHATARLNLGCGFEAVIVPTPLKLPKRNLATLLGQFGESGPEACGSANRDVVDRGAGNLSSGSVGEMRQLREPRISALRFGFPTVARGAPLARFAAAACFRPSEAVKSQAHSSDVNRSTSAQSLC